MQSKGPLVKFKVKARSFWKGFVLIVEPDESDDAFQEEEQRRFIESAIREKLERVQSGEQP